MTKITSQGYLTSLGCSDFLRVSGLPGISVISVIDGVAHFPFQGWICFSSCWECFQQRAALSDQTFQESPQLQRATLPEVKLFLKQAISDDWLKGPSLSAQSKMALMSHFGSPTVEAVDWLYQWMSCFVQSYFIPLPFLGIYHRGIP